MTFFLTLHAPFLQMHTQLSQLVLYGIRFVMSEWLFTPRVETRRTNRHDLRPPARLYGMDTARAARSMMTSRDGMRIIRQSDNIKDFGDDACPQWPLAATKRSTDANATSSPTRRAGRGPPKGDLPLLHQKLDVVAGLGAERLADGLGDRRLAAAGKRGNRHRITVLLTTSKNKKLFSGWMRSRATVDDVSKGRSSEPRSAPQA